MQQNVEPKISFVDLSSKSKCSAKSNTLYGMGQFSQDVNDRSWL